jgi:hypothetical protein
MKKYPKASCVFDRILDVWQIKKLKSIKNYILVVLINLSFANWNTDWESNKNIQLNGSWGFWNEMTVAPKVDNGAWFLLRGNIPMQFSSQLQSWAKDNQQAFLNESERGDQRQALIWGGEAALPLYDGRLKVGWHHNMNLSAKYSDLGAVRNLDTTMGEKSIALIARMNKKSAVEIQSSLLSASYRLDFNNGPHFDFGLSRESWSVRSQLSWEGTLQGTLSENLGLAKQTQDVDIQTSDWNGQGLGVWTGNAWMPKFGFEWRRFRVNWNPEISIELNGKGRVSGKTFKGVDSLTQKWNWNTPDDFTDSANYDEMIKKSTYSWNDSVSALQLKLPSTIQISYDVIENQFWLNYTWWSQDIQAFHENVFLPGLNWQGARKQQLLISVQNQWGWFLQRYHTGILMTEGSSKGSFMATAPYQLDMDWGQKSYAFIPHLQFDFLADFKPMTAFIELSMMPVLNLNFGVHYAF